jgi:phospholipid transport system transporter-binding protein
MSAPMLSLPASLGAAEALGVLDRLSESIAKETNGPVVIDAGALVDFDSSALAVLLQCRREAVASGRVLSLTSAPPRLAQLARLYGVSSLLGLGDDTAPAV